MFAMGYVHAQERLFQMDIQRRMAAGELSELIGPSGLPLDRFFRTLGFRYSKSPLLIRCSVVFTPHVTIANLPTGLWLHR